MSTAKVELRNSIDKIDSPSETDDSISTDGKNDTIQINRQDTTGSNGHARLYLTPSPDANLLNRSREWCTSNVDVINERIISSAKGKLKLDKSLLENISDSRTMQPNVYYEVTQQVTFDCLAMEYLTNEFASVDTRIYLLENILPCVVISIQKLLMQVAKVGTTSQMTSKAPQIKPVFNPLDFLAQQIMRNNPKHNSELVNDPYVKGLALTAVELKRRMFVMEEKKLAKFKSESYEKRMERERIKIAQQQTEEFRLNTLKEVFPNWLIAGLCNVSKLPIHYSLKSFPERTNNIPDITLDHYLLPEKEEFLSNDFLLYSGDDFAYLLIDCVRMVSSDVFQLFIDHLNDCAAAYRFSLIREKRKDLVKEVFLSINGRNNGNLDRHRIVKLFTLFHDHADNSVQNQLVNPKTFVISEFEQDVIQESEKNLIQNDVDSNKTDDNIIIDNQQVLHEKNDRHIEQDRVHDSNDLTEDLQPDALSSSDNTNQIKQELKDDVVEIGNATKQEHILLQQTNTREPIELEENTISETNKVASLTMLETQENAIDETIIVESKASVSLPPTINVKTPNGSTNIESELNENNKIFQPQPKFFDNEVSLVKVQPQQNQEVNASEEQKDNHFNLENINESSQVSLDVTINFDDVKTDSHNTTKDELTLQPTATIGSNSKSKILLSSTKSLSKGSLRLRQQVLSRLSYCSPEPSRRSYRTYSSLGIPWNIDYISYEQFVQLTEFFWGVNPSPEIVESLLKFIKEGYEETKIEREEKIRLENLEKLKRFQMRHLLLLWTYWNYDKSGFVNLEEFQDVSSSWLRFAEFQCLSTLRQIKTSYELEREHAINKEEFLDILSDACVGIDHEELFLDYIEFMKKSIKMSLEERQRGKLRQEWLDNIVTVSRTCGLTFEPVVKTALGCIYKDTEQHGTGKRVKCNVGMLELIRGVKCLHYIAASQDDLDGVVGKILKDGHKCLGFSVIDQKQTVHIQNILNSKQPIHLFFPNRRSLDKERNGSFVCSPLLHPFGHAIGVLGIDTLSEIEKKEILPHEVSFYQGVARTLGEAYSYVELRIKLVKILHSAFTWTLTKASCINSISVYIVEDPPANRDNDGFILRNVLTMVQGETNAKEVPNAPRMFIEDDLFKEYLFKCAINSEATTTSTFGSLHWTIPVRDYEGLPLAILDLDIGTKNLPKSQEENVLWMVRLVAIAVLELSQGYRQPPTSHVLEAETVDEETRLAVLFSRVMLTDLRNKVEKLDSSAYAEIKSYIDPPKIIHDILKSVLYIFSPEKLAVFDAWKDCKAYINSELNKNISAFDPTSNTIGAIDHIILRNLLNLVPVGEVEKHGSLPAKYLHDWALVCLSLLEHTSRMYDTFQNRPQ